MFVDFSNLGMYYFLKIKENKGGENSKMTAKFSTIYSSSTKSPIVLSLRMYYSTAKHRDPSSHVWLPTLEQNAFAALISTALKWLATLPKGECLC